MGLRGKLGAAHKVIDLLWDEIRLGLIPVRLSSARFVGPPLPHGDVETRFLGVLLCYNDDDMLQPVIEHFIRNHHDIVILDHQSEDDTEAIARSYLGRGVIEYIKVNRKVVPFRYLYTAAARYLFSQYGGLYDWLSFPDQDEILMGPDLSRPYFQQVQELLANGYDWMEFKNFVFWFTDKDDASIVDPVKRIRYYALHPKKRIRAWRLPITNKRLFANANPLPGVKSPVPWPLMHYPMRSEAQARKRVEHDRNQPGFRFGGKNWHYDALRQDLSKLLVPAEQLSFFGGRTLNGTRRWNMQGGVQVEGANVEG